MIAVMCAIKAGKCEDSGCSKPILNFDCVPTSECDQEKSREVSEDDRTCLKEALNEVQRSLSSQSKIMMFDSTGIVGHGLSDDLIDTIVSNVHNFFIMCVTLFTHLSRIESQHQFLITSLVPAVFTLPKPIPSCMWYVVYHRSTSNTTTPSFPWI